MSVYLLRIELRRSTVLLLLPILATVAMLSPAWRHLSALALWPARSIDAQTALQGVGPLFAGTAAWVAGRERRRGMEDLLATTPQTPWTRLLIMWAATTLWGLLLYAVIVAVILGVTTLQATWGAPVPWPLLVGLLTLPALAAIGCALGHSIPSRFAPPLAGVGVFVAQGLGPTLVNHGSTLGLLAPGDPSISFSVWSASSADHGLIQVLFLLGMTALGLGSLGLRKRPFLQAARAAGMVAVAGLALTAASVALVLNSRIDDGNVWVPLFGETATTTITSYTPVCRTGPLPVCVHPAYRPQLTETAALLNRLAAPVLGLPDAPIRAVQQPVRTARVVRDGTQQVLTFTPIDFHDPTNPPHLVQGWIGQVAVSLVADYPEAAGRRWTADKAQNAVALYLLHRAKASFDPTQFDQGPDVGVAEQRFAALSTEVRRTWLRTHYILLRQGRVSLEELP